MIFEIPPTGGKNPVPVPIILLPSFSAQDTCLSGRYLEGTHILINGRLYPNEDGKLYVVPTQPLENLKVPINLNQVNIAGDVGYISEQVSEDTLNFGMFVKAPPQKAIDHTWQDCLLFGCESWGDDAKRLRRFIYRGRAISLGGRVKFDTCIDDDGKRRGQFKVILRSLQYSFLGKNKLIKNLKNRYRNKET